MSRLNGSCPVCYLGRTRNWLASAARARSPPWKSLRYSSVSRRCWRASPLSPPLRGLKSHRRPAAPSAPPRPAAAPREVGCIHHERIHGHSADQRRAPSADQHATLVAHTRIAVAGESDVTPRHIFCRLHYRNEQCDYKRPFQAPPFQAGCLCELTCSAGGGHGRRWTEGGPYSVSKPLRTISTSFWGGYGFCRKLTPSRRATSLPIKSGL